MCVLRQVWNFLEAFGSTHLFQLQINLLLVNVKHQKRAAVNTSLEVMEQNENLEKTKEKCSKNDQAGKVTTRFVTGLACSDGKEQIQKWADINFRENILFYKPHAIMAYCCSRKGNTKLPKIKESIKIGKMQYNLNHRLLKIHLINQIILKTIHFPHKKYFLLN